MEEKQLHALKKSIEKWESIAHRNGVDLGALNCELCQTCPNCLQCPIVDRVNGFGCFKTPYVDFCSHWNNTHETYLTAKKGKPVLCGTCKALAIAELDFLKSLLPLETKEE